MSGVAGVARGRGGRPRGGGRRGSAFLVEALVLLAFLVAALAVFVALFSAARTRSTEAAQLTEAVAEAREAAERFAADPATAGGTAEQEGLTVTVETAADDAGGAGAGTLWRAVITVRSAEDGAEVYRLETERYVGGAGGEGVADGAGGDAS